MNKDDLVRERIRDQKLDTEVRDLMFEVDGKLPTNCEVDRLLRFLHLGWDRLIPFFGDNLPGFVATTEEEFETEFFVKTSNVTIQKANVVNIHNTTASRTTAKEVRTYNQIEDNLLLLAKEGIPFRRLTDYHVKVRLNGVDWNLFISGKEKFMRDGCREEGRGVRDFIQMYKADLNL